MQRAAGRETTVGVGSLVMPTVSRRVLGVWLGTAIAVAVTVEGQPAPVRQGGPAPVTFGGFTWQPLGGATLTATGGGLTIDPVGTSSGGAEVDLGATHGVAIDVLLDPLQLVDGTELTFAAGTAQPPTDIVSLRSTVDVPPLAGDPRHALTPVFDANPAASYGVALRHLGETMLLVLDDPSGPVVNAALGPQPRLTLTSRRTVELSGLVPTSVTIELDGGMTVIPVDADTVIFFADPATPPPPGVVEVFDRMTISTSSLDDLAVGVPTARFDALPVIASGGAELLLDTDLDLVNGGPPPTPAGVTTPLGMAKAATLRLGSLDPGSWPPAANVTLRWGLVDTNGPSFDNALITLTPVTVGLETELAVAFDLPGSGQEVVVIDGAGVTHGPFTPATGAIARFAPTGCVFETALDSVGTSPTASIHFDADTDVTILSDGQTIMARTILARTTAGVPTFDALIDSTLETTRVPSVKVPKLGERFFDDPTDTTSTNAEISIFTCDAPHPAAHYQYFICVDNTLGTTPLDYAIETTPPDGSWMPTPFADLCTPGSPPELCWPPGTLAKTKRCVVGVEGVTGPTDDILHYDGIVVTSGPGSPFEVDNTKRISPGAGISPWPSPCAAYVCTTPIDELVLCGDEDEVLFANGFESGDTSRWDTVVQGN